MALFNTGVDPSALPNLPPDLLAMMGGSAPISPSADTDITATGGIPGTTETSAPTISAAPAKVPAAVTPSDVSAASTSTSEAESPTKQFLRKLAAIGMILAPPLGVAGAAMLGPSPEGKARAAMARAERQAELEQMQMRTKLVGAQAESLLKAPTVSPLDEARVKLINAQTDYEKARLVQLQSPADTELNNRFVEAQIGVQNALKEWHHAQAQHQERMGVVSQKLEGAIAPMFSDIASGKRDLTKRPMTENEKFLIRAYGILKQAGTGMGIVNPAFMDQIDAIMPRAKAEAAGKTAEAGLPDALKGTSGVKGKDRYTKDGVTWDWNYSTKAWERK